MAEADTEEPRRFVDANSDVPDPIRALFRAGVADVGTATELGRIRSGLQSRLANHERPQGPSLSRPLKILGALGGAAVVIAGVTAILDARTPSAPPSSAPSSAPVSDQTAPPSATVSAEPATPAPANPAPVIAPSASAAPAPSAPAASRATKATGPSEADLLEQARRALKTDPARALALTRQHQARFPNGVLRQEREVIAIEALRRLGRSSEASERAGSFEKQFPDSAHRRAVEGGLSR